MTTNTTWEMGNVPGVIATVSCTTPTLTVTPWAPAGRGASVRRNSEATQGIAHRCEVARGRNAIRGSERGRIDRLHYKPVVRRPNRAIALRMRRRGGGLGPAA